MCVELRKELLCMPKKRKSLTDLLEKYYDLISISEESEKWKILNIGDKPLYEISNHGRIRNISSGIIINPFHGYRRTKDGKINYERPTYLRIQIYYYENGVRKKRHYEISRLVAKMFIPIPDKYTKIGLNENDLEVNHLDGKLYNNFEDNLEWATTKENIIHSHNTCLCNVNYGEKHFKTYLSEIDVLYICESIESGIGVRECYKNFNRKDKISYKKFKPCYYNIKYKKSWLSISQYFNF